MLKFNVCGERHRAFAETVHLVIRTVIYSQRRLSHSLFKPYTRLYYESWYGVLSLLNYLTKGYRYQMGGSTANLYWKEVAIYKFFGKTHPKVVYIYC